MNCAVLENLNTGTTPQLTPRLSSTLNDRGGGGGYFTPYRVYIPHLHIYKGG